MAAQTSGQRSRSTVPARCSSHSTGINCTLSRLATDPFATPASGPSATSTPMSRTVVVMGGDEHATESFGDGRASQHQDGTDPVQVGLHTAVFDARSDGSSQTRGPEIVASIPDRSSISLIQTPG